jgi:hypothetical protein
VLIGLGIGIGAILLAAGIALYIISRDEAPPDDSDLIVKRLDISENGFSYFQQAGAVLYWPGTEAWKKSGKYPEPENLEINPDDPQAKAAREIRDRLDKMLDGKDWDEALAKEILDANWQTFRRIELGLDCREFQAPEFKSFHDEMPYVLGFMQTARLMRLRAADLAARNKGIEAVERVLDVVSFGHRIVCAKGCLVNWLVGQTIKGMGLEQLRRLVIECKAPAETLRMTAARLADWGDSGTGLADALRCEYQMDVNMIDEMYCGNMSIYIFTIVGREPPRPSLYERLKVVLFLRPNQTKRLFAETLRPRVEDSTRPYAAARTQPVALDAPGGLLQMLPSKNSVGRMLHQIFNPALSGALKVKSQTQTDLAATRAIVALKAFKMKTGRLPKTLDELVPEYLAAVPLDDFDGKPLRYSPEKKILYSVGKDLKDVGGSTKEETRKWWEKEYPGQSPEDVPSVPVWDLPNPSWPIEF